MNKNEMIKLITDKQKLNESLIQEGIDETIERIAYKKNLLERINLLNDCMKYVNDRLNEIDHYKTVLTYITQMGDE